MFVLHCSQEFSVICFRRYKSSPNENKSLEALFLDDNTSRDRHSSGKVWGSFEPESRQPSSGSYASDDGPPSRKEPVPASSSSVGNEAQKKFGSAKAISSEQFFGDSADNSVSSGLVIVDMLYYCPRTSSYLSLFMVSCILESVCRL